MSTEDNKVSSDGSLVLPPREGKTLSVLGNQMMYKAVSEDTSGAYVLIEWTTPSAFQAVPPHIHKDLDEAFYVLEGELTLQVGEHTVHETAGSFVFIPRGVVHTFSNLGTQPVRYLQVISPPGFEKVFEELAASLPAGAPPDMKIVGSIFQKYDMEMAGQPHRHE